MILLDYVNSFINLINNLSEKLHKKCNNFMRLLNMEKLKIISNTYPIIFVAHKYILHKFNINREHGSLIFLLHLPINRLTNSRPGHLRHSPCHFLSVFFDRWNIEMPTSITQCHWQLKQKSVLIMQLLKLQNFPRIFLVLFVLGWFVNF